MVQTIAELFYKALERDFETALAHRSDGVWRSISHRELQARVERLALAMAVRGLRAGDRLGILAENRPEWAVADYACAVSRIITVPVYATLGPAQTAHILGHCKARWLVCSTRAQLDKVLEIRPQLPDLQVLVLMEGEPPSVEGLTVLGWEQLLAEGAALERRRPEIRARAMEIKPSDLLTLIYTSGTTGDPKGVMLTHGNLASNIVRALDVMAVEAGQRCLSILPLSHIFERMAGHYTLFHAGVAIYYSESLQTVVRDIKEVKPELFLAVPRVYEKIYGRVREQVAAKGLASRLVFHYVMAVGRRLAPYGYRDRPLPFHLRLARKLCDRLVFAKVRDLLGGRLQLSACGGAAIHPRILEFFWAAGIPLFEGYGLTEASPLLAMNQRGDMVPGTVGRPIYDQWQGRPFLKLGPDGEILCQGPNVMAGYWNDPEATRAVMDAEGYFHTGDIGALDAGGRLRITDRKKELLVTSGGKNVAPQPLENALRADKYIEQAIVVGDGRNFVSALIVPNFPNLRRWAEYKKLAFPTDGDLARSPEAMAKLMDRVERVNAHFSNYERVKKIVILERELTTDSGFLTPSMKLRRRAIVEAFAREIASMYDDKV